MPPTVLTEMLGAADVADRLHVSSNALLGLCAEGRLRAKAPVLNAGWYKWPNGNWNIALPQLDRPAMHRFGPSDRVLLSQDELSTLQACGRVNVREFSAPDVARKIILDWSVWFEEEAQLEAKFCQTDSQGLRSVTEIWSSKGPFFRMDELATQSLWKPAKLELKNPKYTRLEHLYFYTDDVSRLQEDMRPRSLPIVHGNADLNAAEREEVFAAALYLLHRDPRSYPDAQALARGLTQHSNTFWGSVPNWPRSERTMRDLIAAAIRTGKPMRRK